MAWPHPCYIKSNVLHSLPVCSGFVPSRPVRVSLTRQGLGLAMPCRRPMPPCLMPWDKAKPPLQGHVTAAPCHRAMPCRPSYATGLWHTTIPAMTRWYLVCHWTRHRTLVCHGLASDTLVCHASGILYATVANLAWQILAPPATNPLPRHIGRPPRVRFLPTQIQTPHISQIQTRQNPNFSPAST